MPISTTSVHSAQVSKRGAGTRIHVLGAEITVKISSTETDGAFTVFEAFTDPLHGPPLHRHQDEDEWWYIIDGDFRFEVDGEELFARTGDTVFAPRGSRHTFQNIGNRPGHTLTTAVPGGIDEFFQDLEKAAPRGAAPDPAKLRPVFDRHRQELLGPPLHARPGSPKQTPPTDEEVIREQLKRHEAAWNRGDSAACAKWFAEDATQIHIFGGQLDGRPAIEAAYRRIFATIYRGSRAEFRLLSIRPVKPDAAIAFTHARVQFEEAGQPREIQVRPTLVLEKIRGDWRIVAFQNTRVTEPPTPIEPLHCPAD